MHHIIGDGWSMQIFFGEWLSLYADDHAGLRPLAVQYRDYALWQATRDWSEERVYWQTQDSNAAGRRLYDQVARHFGFIVYSHEMQAFIRGHAQGDQPCLGPQAS